jgi:hypothetical protein
MRLILTQMGKEEAEGLPFTVQNELLKLAKVIMEKLDSS